MLQRGVCLINSRINNCHRPALAFAHSSRSRLFTAKSSSGGSLMDTVDMVRAKLQHNENSSSSWEDLWRDGLTPWDLGKPTPLLISELEKERTNTVLPKRRMRTLVPGCGRGYDLLTLQSHHNYVVMQQQQQESSSSGSSGMESAVVGLDVSAAALISAETIVRGHVSNLTRLDLKCGDFFDPPEDWDIVYSSRERDKGEQPSVSQFDFIFDYTFFCALPPNLRSNWGTQIAKLLDPTSGRLLTVIFPILPGAPMQGAPYPVCTQDYVDALLPHGISMEGEPFESPFSVPSRTGNEMICYWKFDQAQQSASL